MTLQYYENRVLSSGEFRIAEVNLKGISGKNKWAGAIGELTINYPINLQEGYKIKDLKFAEGVKACLIPDNMFVVSSISIPSTCEEIDTNLENDSITINYNGTIEDFNNIKGAQEFISQIESLGEYTIACTNGNITNRK